MRTSYCTYCGQPLDTAFNCYNPKCNGNDCTVITTSDNTTTRSNLELLNDELKRLTIEFENEINNQKAIKKYT